MRLLLAAITLSIALAGCSAVGGSDAPEAGEPALSSPTATRPAPTATPSTTTVSTRCDGSIEGCFTYKEMDEYLDAITPMVAGFFQTHFSKVAQPRNLVYVPRGQGVRTACGASDSQAYEYCPGNQTIYIGQDLLLALHAQGLGSVLTTRWKTKEADVKQLLGIPEDYDLHVIVPVGWPDRKYGRGNRVSVREVTFADRFGQPWLLAERPPSVG